MSASSYHSGSFSRYRGIRMTVFGSPIFCVLLSFAAAIQSGCAKREATPAAPAEKILRISQRNEPATLDPQLATLPDEFFIIRALGEGLLTPNPDGGAPLPGVAERYEVSPDSLAYTFHLRPNAKWSNGNAVTSEDFAAMISAVKAPGSLAPKAQLFAAVRTVTTPDPRTLIITLQQPTPDFPALVASGPWIPARQAGRIGNGPFILTEWKPNQHITVRKKPALLGRRQRAPRRHPLPRNGQRRHRGTRLPLRPARRDDGRALHQARRLPRGAAFPAPLRAACGNPLHCAQHHPPAARRRPRPPRPRAGPQPPNAGGKGGPHRPARLQLRARRPRRLLTDHAPDGRHRRSPPPARRRRFPGRPRFSPPRAGHLGQLPGARSRPAAMAPRTRHRGRPRATRGSHAPRRPRRRRLRDGVHDRHPRLRRRRRPAHPADHRQPRQLPPLARRRLRPARRRRRLACVRKAPARGHAAHPALFQHAELPRLPAREKLAGRPALDAVLSRRVRRNSRLGNSALATCPGPSTVGVPL
jgi:hypothetical protein